PPQVAGITEAAEVLFTVRARSRNRPSNPRTGPSIGILHPVLARSDDLLYLGEAQLFGKTVGLGEAAQLVPGGIFYLDPVGAAVPLPHVLDFTRIIDATAALSGLCRLQVLGEPGDVLLELTEGPASV